MRGEDEHLGIQKAGCWFHHSDRLIVRRHLIDSTLLIGDHSEQIESQILWV